MSKFKFLPFTDPKNLCFRPLITKKWFLLINHWLVPFFSNWHEPLPYPKIRHAQAPDNDIQAWIWWSLRNWAHNPTHFGMKNPFMAAIPFTLTFLGQWPFALLFLLVFRPFGITPVGKRNEWISPEENGWRDSKLYWTKSILGNRYHIALPRWYGHGIGWTERGSFKMGTGRKAADTIVMVSAVIFLITIGLLLNGVIG